MGYGNAQKHAVGAGVAHYIVDAKTGKTTFVYNNQLK